MDEDEVEIEQERVEQMACGNCGAIVFSDEARCPDCNEPM